MYVGFPRRTLGFAVLPTLQVLALVMEIPAQFLILEGNGNRYLQFEYSSVMRGGCLVKGSHIYWCQPANVRWNAPRGTSTL